MNLKERLKAYLSPDEIVQLELQGETYFGEISKQSNSNSILKLPVFQPTAAAAMMYNIQNSQQMEKLKVKKNEMSLNNLYVNQNLVKKSTSPMLESNTLDVNLVNEILSKRSPSEQTLERPLSINSGKVSSSLIANVLKKDSEDYSKKSYKLLPYICLRCKKDVVLCDSPAQTNPNDLDEKNCFRVKFAKEPELVSSQFLRSKTIGFGMSKMNSSHHQKNASADLSSLKLSENGSEDVFSTLCVENTNNFHRKQEKERIDSWADLDSVSTVI